MSYSINQRDPRMTQPNSQRVSQPAPLFTTGSYNTQTDTQASLQSTPETIILECNRLTSRQDDNEADAYNTNHRWTTEFTNGIEVKQGDEIRINSAFLSSIGVGDLIGWTNNPNDPNQDNKGTWLYSVYCCNDGINDKREGYNMIGGDGIFPYDTDNSPCPLMRVSPTNTLGTPRTIISAGNVSVSYHQDPYLPCRFYGETFTIATPTLSNNFIITIIPQNNTGGVDTGTMIRIQKYTANDTLVDIKPSDLFGVGQTFMVVPETQPFHTANPNAYNIAVGKFIFTCCGFKTIVATEFMLVEDLSNLTHNQINPLTTNILITCHFKVATLPFRLSNDNWYYTTLTFDTNEGRTPFIENGTTLYEYSFSGIENGETFTPLNNDERFLGLIDNQTGNEIMECEIVNSPISQSNLQVEIHIVDLSLQNPAIPTNQQQQNITFRIPNQNITTTQQLIDFLGSNLIVFDLYDSEFQNREIATCMIIDKNINNGVDNITFVNNDIVCLNVKRQANHSQTNLLTLGQNDSGNLRPDPTQKYYIYKVANYFQDITATYSHLDIKQFQALSNDFSTNTNLLTAIPYYVYIPVVDKSIAPNNFSISNNYTQQTDNFYSSFVNLVNNNNEGKQQNTPYFYNGYYDIDDQARVEVIHYQQKQFEITENYSNPSDIATTLTDQTHETRNVRDTTGVEIPNSKNFSLIQNDFFFPVFSSHDDTNTENVSGELNGILDLGSFYLKYKLKNSSVKHPNTNNVATIPQYAPDGEYKIWFKTRHTSINKPTMSNTTDGNNTKAYTLDFNQGNPSGIAPQVEHAETYEADGTTIMGFPINYITGLDCFCSQYAGSNNISFTWDDATSRFKIDYLHQPSMSKFEANSSGVLQDGNEISATIYYPSPIGNNNNLYKLPRTRCGGINIENWTSHLFTYPSTPNAIRKQTNLPSNVLMNTDWFLTDTTIDPLKPQLQNNFDPIGFKFWSKLGFSNSQMYKDSVGGGYNADNDRYEPNGTTDNSVEIADALITAKEPAENTPFFKTSEAYSGSTSQEATYQFSSIGALQLNNHLTGYGLPNTSGLPLSFQANVSATDSGQNKNPTFSQYESTYNPDRERNNGFTFQTQGKSLEAINLPTKTEFPYFYVMSDIVKTDFNISANYGSKLNCVGIISKLNAEQDFYFQYQAPQSFYAKKDRLLTSITTEIRTPDLRIPPALAPYSSMIYQIVRYNPRPTTLSAPIWWQQEQYFDMIKNMVKNYADSQKPVKQTDQQRLNEIMTEVATSIERPNEQTSGLVQRIISNYDRLNLERFKGDPTALRQFFLTNPDAEPLMRDLTAFRNLPEAPETATDPESTNEDTMLNSLLQAQPETRLPADREVEDDYGGSARPYLPPPALVPPPDQSSLYEYVMSRMTNFGGRLGVENPLPQGFTQEDMDSIVGSGVDPERLIQLQEAFMERQSQSQSGIPIALGSLTDPVRDRVGGGRAFLEAVMGANQSTPISQLPTASNPSIADSGGGGSSELETMVGDTPQDRVRQLADIEKVEKESGYETASSGRSSVPPSYKSKESKPPSFKTIDEEDEEEK